MKLVVLIAALMVVLALSEGMFHSLSPSKADHNFSCANLFLKLGLKFPKNKFKFK